MCFANMNHQKLKNDIVTSRPCYYIIYKELSRIGRPRRFLLNKIFSQVNTIATQPDPPVRCPPSQISSSQTSFSLPATVCYEADGKYQRLIRFSSLYQIFEGILVVQLEWRGKTYFGTLLSQDKCDR